MSLASAIVESLFYEVGERQSGKIRKKREISKALFSEVRICSLHFGIVVSRIQMMGSNSPFRVRLCHW